jgi:hypothetical protein
LISISRFSTSVRSSGNFLPYVEILLKISAMAGARRKVHVIAWREPAI